MGKLAIIGTGYVADLYMRSLRTFPELKVVAAFDADAPRLEAFSTYWGVPKASSLEELLRHGNGIDLILNLTNPGSHHSVSRRCLEAGLPVYSEKPLAVSMDQALELHELARSRGLVLASAPCSVLSKTAQTAWRALRDGRIGKPLLVYAEMDDDFIAQAPYSKWKSESGAPWPSRDEFKVGCTLEHAGYYLTWLMAMFGSVRSVVSYSTEVVPGKLPNDETCAPDYSSASLVFESGMVARLTCSIVAPHDHSLRIFGTHGILEVDECWNNAAPVGVRRRLVLRRRLVNSPFRQRVRLPEPTHPMVGRRGAASMNFALGPAEVLASLREKRPCRLGADFSLHLNEVTLAIQNAGASGAQAMTTSFASIQPMDWARTGEAGSTPA